MIEQAAPYLAEALRPQVDEVLLVGGEASVGSWQSEFRERLGGARLRCSMSPDLGYLSNRPAHPQTMAKRIRRHLQRLLAEAEPGHCVVWAHNLGLGRNPLLARELTRLCAQRNIPLVAHHHDWWFDNRWARWAEMRRAGFRTASQVARSIFAAGPNVRHIAINQADARLLQRHFGRQAGWLPNLCEPIDRPLVQHARAARLWLSQQLGDEAPVWVMPCRLLRRKNIAEALLLTRWLRPEAWLVTTGGVSSQEERDYADTLESAAKQRGWRLRLGILKGDDRAEPSVAELLAASEAVLLTSLLEGFGFPYLEALAARRPLLARLLPNVAPDLERFGFQFPQSYDELWVDSDLFDCEAERTRQKKLFSDWNRRIPRSFRRWLCRPGLVGSTETPKAVPFSRLTTTAQLEVLGQPLAESWARCSALNPFLKVWRRRVLAGRLRLASWPRKAEAWLNGKTYALRFQEILRHSVKSGARVNASIRVQRDFIRQKLGSGQLYPLLWSRKT